MVKRDVRGHAERMAPFQHPTIEVEFRQGELTFFRLDPGPFDGEPEAVQTKRPEPRDVLRIPMVTVARVARRLAERRALQVFHHPKVRRIVVAFILVTGRRRSPEKMRREAAVTRSVSVIAARPRPGRLARTGDPERRDPSGAPGEQTTSAGVNGLGHESSISGFGRLSPRQLIPLGTAHTFL